MAAANALGPYERLPMGGGSTAPLYLIPFDKNGHCQGPLTLEHLLQELSSGKYTDVHVFSHGWNNVFKDAVQLYRGFFGHYFDLRKQQGLSDAGYSPVLVGILWPSTLLVLPWEQAPHIAAIAGGPEKDELLGADMQVIADVAEDLAPAQAQRLYALAERGPSLTPAEVRELATLLLPIYQTAIAGAQSSEVGGNPSAVTVEDILDTWRKVLPRQTGSSTEAGFASDTSTAELGFAGADITWLDPRWAVRVASVLKMKDRAGRVGTQGVGPELVQKLLAIEKLRTHLIGHSYGAKVILSSLCCQPPKSKAASLLLLEPAISYLCFGENLGGAGRRGGYRDALDRVAQPILSTFSRSDAPLTKFFHLAVIRDSDWGEQKIAGAPPNKFAALGGFGPGGLKQGESKTIEVLSPVTPYPHETGIRIYGLNGSHGQIKGHGDVATAFTAWAHLSLVNSAGGIT